MDAKILQRLPQAVPERRARINSTGGDTEADVKKRVNPTPRGIAALPGNAK